MAELGSQLTSSESEKLSSTILIEDDNYEAEYDLYLVTKSYFDCKEYQRAFKVSSDCKSNKLYFLRLYSWYMVSWVVGYDFIPASYYTAYQE